MSDEDEEIQRELARSSREAEHMAKGPEIPVSPLAGWSTATLPDNLLLLVLEFLTGPQPIETHMLRLGMTRSQCAALALALDRLAKAPHVLPPDKPS